MKLKRNITVGAGALLVLLLGIAMVCGGCKQKTGADWDYTGTVNQSNDDTTPSASDTIPSTSATPTPVGPDETAPSVEISITDREDFGTTTDNTTAPTTGSNTGTTGGNTGTTGNNTGTTAPTTGDTTPELDENGYWTYEYYVSRTGEEQMEYYKTFPSMRAFNQWYNDAKDAYEAAHPKETITDGNINLN